MRSEPILASLAKTLQPTASQKRAIKARVMQAQPVETWLQSVARFLMPTLAKRQQVRSLLHIADPIEKSLYSTKAALVPHPSLKQLIFMRVEEGMLRKANHWLQINSYRWFAAFTAAVMIVTLSPRFLLAPQSLADSEVRLQVISGEVLYGIGDELAPVTSTVKVAPGATIETNTGVATVSYKDDAVIRLDPFTRITIYDTQSISDLASELLPTVTVTSGQVWVQGLMSSTIRGLTFRVPNGLLTVHEGSFSVQVGTDTALVSVWDRGLSVATEAKTERIGSSTRIALQKDSLTSTIIDSVEYASDFVKQNLAKDAVHRAYIATVQEERLREVAGTLPTSAFYPVKSFAEKMDIMFTINKEDRLEKQINQAANRLSEAVALLADDSTQEAGEDSLRKYKEAVGSILVASADDSLPQLLLSQSLQDIQANTAALKPNDPAYAAKEAVLEVQSAVLGTEDIASATIIADTLDVVSEALASGNTEVLQEHWTVVEVALKHSDGSSDAKTDVQSEAVRIAQIIQGSAELTESLSATQLELLSTVVLVPELEPEEVVVAPKPAAPVVAKSTKEQADAYALRMYRNIYNSTSMRDRVSTLRVQLLALKGSSNEGSVLRSLERILPENSELSLPITNRLNQLRLQSN